MSVLWGTGKSSLLMAEMRKTHGQVKLFLQHIEDPVKYKIAYPWLSSFTGVTTYTGEACRTVMTLGGRGGEASRSEK